MATRSPGRWPSACRSATSRLLALPLALAAAGCGGGDDDGECGPGAAPASGVTVSAGADAIEFGQFRSSPNNDCTAPGGGPTSLTVQGDQTDPAAASRFLVLCLPRPDRIGADPIALGDEELVQLVDLLATAGDCRLDLDRERAPAGTVSFGGYCDDGSDPGGYSLAFDATVPLLRTCPDGEPEPVDAELGGAAAVSVAGG